MDFLGCPFCGTSAKVDTIVTIDWDEQSDDEIEAYAVYCPDGECLGHTCRERWFRTVELAAEAWNRRS